ILHFGKFFHVRLNQLQNRSPVRFLRPTGKSAIAQIAREPDATADYDLMMRPLAAEPFSGVRHDIRKFHNPIPPVRFRVVLFGRVTTRPSRTFLPPPRFGGLRSCFASCRSTLQRYARAGGL